MTADPVQVVAEALAQAPRSKEPDPAMWKHVALEAVTALAANPDALAALLEPVGWAYRVDHGYGGWHLCADAPIAHRQRKRVYRLPDPS